MNIKEREKLQVGDIVKYSNGTEIKSSCRNKEAVILEKRNCNDFRVRLIGETKIMSVSGHFWISSRSGMNRNGANEVVSVSEGTNT